MKTKSTPKSTKSIGLRLGGNIAQARHAKGWTQQELAEMIGVDPVSLSRIETGASLPSISRLVEIADILNISLTSLVSGISGKINDQAQEIAGILQKLSASDRQLVVDLLKQFAGRLAKK
jgi:transcriptional regulator with XRE-family HTH domain